MKVLITILLVAAISACGTEVTPEVLELAEEETTEPEPDPEVIVEPVETAKVPAVDTVEEEVIVEEIRENPFVIENDFFKDTIEVIEIDGVEVEVLRLRTDKTDNINIVYTYRFEGLATMELDRVYSDFETGYSLVSHYLIHSNGENHYMDEYFYPEVYPGDVICLKLDYFNDSYEKREFINGNVVLTGPGTISIQNPLAIAAWIADCSESLF